jgi:hypothetical protein
MEREAKERSEGLGRVHGRIDDVAVTQAAMKTTLEGMPASIAAQINISAKAQKLWTYGLIVAAGGLVLWDVLKPVVIKGGG